jgi:predicted acyltransferase
MPCSADGMTLADTVFPAVLFLVGASIALAFERAEPAGKSKVAQLGHIFTRTAALPFMGVIGPTAPALAAIAGWIAGLEHYVSLRDALGSLAGRWGLD